MKRKLSALLLALIMLLALLPQAFTAQVAVADSAPIDQSIVEGGAILHCFDWSYKEIIDNLDAIQAAGYTAVQTSPVQPPKDYNAAWTDGGGQWWKLYQPLGFRIADANETWLANDGATLEQLCTEAHAKDIKVIVDVVANHLANKEGGGYYLDKDGNGSPDDLNGDGEINALDANLSEQVDDAFQNHPEYFHANTASVNDGSRYNMTQNQMGMPDLNTSNQFVQQEVYTFLVECVDCGVDGFRFDAAKHIELPGDSGCDSDFWSAILNGVDTDSDIMGIRAYAASKGQEVFIYGESLSGNAGEAWVDEFTNNYMALTDSNYGGRMREALNETNAGKLGDGSYVRCNDARGNVVWVESHDTYEDGASSGIESDKIVKAWAIVGARADSTALYFARPNGIMGKASSDTTWKSAAVAEINKFKNHYNGTKEYLHQNYDNKVAWIERGASGNAGVCISKLDGAGAVSLELEWMADGTYKDEITGNIFTVSNKTITGSVGPTGVAVVYKLVEVTPSEYITADPIYLVPGDWDVANATERFELYVFNNDSNAFVTMTDADGDGIYEANLPTGQWTNLIFIRMDASKPEHNWDSKWNQTGNLVPNPGTDTYIIAGWGENDGYWSTSADTGYYIVGTMTGWAIVPEFKMEPTTADTEEYTLDVELIRTSNSRSQFKVVYSPDGVTKQTWYPDGLNNNYGDYAGEIPTSGVYHVYFRPGKNGGSDWHDGYIYAAQSEYYINISDADKNGAVEVDKETAAPGDTVTVTILPHAGYELDTIVYRYETAPNSNTFETVSIENGSFVMPAYNVTVEGTFKRIDREPVFKTQSLTLGGEIGVNFYMDLSMLTYNEKVNSYMIFTVGTENKQVESRADFSNANFNGSTWGFTCYVNAIQMADEIKPVFHYTPDGSSEEKTVERSSAYSVRMYVAESLNPDNTTQPDATTAALETRLIDYGHFVQIYLQQLRGWTFGTDYTAIDLYGELTPSYSNNYDAIKAELEHDNYAFLKNISDVSEIEKITYSLVLDSKTTIRVYIKPAANYDGEITVSGDASEATKQSDGRYLVEFKDIGAHELGTPYTIYINDDAATVTVSAMSYVFGMLDKEGASTEAKNAVCSIYYYWKAAMNYLTAHQS